MVIKKIQILRGLLMEVLSVTGYVVLLYIICLMIEVVVS